MAKSLLVTASGTNTFVASTSNFSNLTHGTRPQNNSFEGFTESILQAAGTFSNFHSRVVTNGTSGSSTIQLRTNGGNASESLSIGIAATGEFTDASHTDALSVADTIAVQVVVGAGGNIVLSILSVIFDPAVQNSKVMTGSQNNGGTSTNSVTLYQFLLSSIANSRSNENETQEKIYAAGTLSKFSVKISSNARITSTTYGTRVNGVNGNQSISIGSGSTGDFLDASNSDAVVAGDLVNSYITTSTGSGFMGEDLRYCIVEMSDGQDHCFSGHGQISADGTTITANLTRYNHVAGQMSIETTEANASEDVAIKGGWKGLGVHISSNTLVGASTVTGRVNAADGAQSASITSLTTGFFEDTSHADTLAAGDNVNYKIVTPATGTSMLVRYFRSVLAFAAPKSTTKSLAYAVKSTPSAKTKSLQYEILKHLATTKGLRYAVKTHGSTTKGLRYAVKTKIANTKGLQYEVLKHLAATKGMQYAIKTASHASTKSLQYVIRISRMRQSLFHSSGADSTGASDFFQGIYESDTLAWTSTSTIRGGIITTPGTLKFARVILSASPGSGKSRTFVLQKNGVDTAISVTISNTSTTGQDSANSVSVVAGDVIKWRSQRSGTPTGALTRLCIMFESWNDKESLIIGSSSSFTSTNAQRYINLSGQHGTESSSESLLKQICSSAGTIKNFWLTLYVAPGAGKTRVFAIRKNGADTGVTLTISGTATSGSDLSNSFTVAAGDEISLGATGTGTPAASGAEWGATFAANVSGESLVLGNTAVAASTSAANYLPINASFGSWGSTESDRFTNAPKMKMKNLYVSMDTAPGSGKNRIHNLRQNSTNPAGGLSVTIADSATSGNDTSNSNTIANDDVLTIRNLPSGTPAASASRWGMTMFIPPLVEVSKGLQYVVKSKQATTKALQYEVLSHVQATKGLQYRIKLVFPITKSDRYAIKSKQPKTKSLQYAVLSDVQATKGLIYRIKIAGNAATKSLAYAVRTVAEQSKDARYAVRKAKSTTKALEYRIDGAAMIDLPKDLSYAITAEYEAQKTMMYDVMIKAAQTKSAAYKIKAPKGLSKSARYAVLNQDQSITKDAQYAISVLHAFTKGLTYDVKAGHQIQKSAAYDVKTGTPDAKSLAYAIRVSTDASKAMIYLVGPSGTDIGKSMAYVVSVGAAITKGMSYVMKRFPYHPKGFNPYSRKNPPYVPLPR